MTVTTTDGLGNVELSGGAAVAIYSTPGRSPGSHSTELSTTRVRDQPGKSPYGFNAWYLDACASAHPDGSIECCMGYYIIKLLPEVVLDRAPGISIVYLPIHFTICIGIYPSIHPSIDRTINYLSIYVHVYIQINKFICMYIYIYIYIYI